MLGLMSEENTPVKRTGAAKVQNEPIIVNGLKISNT